MSCRPDKAVVLALVTCGVAGAGCASPGGNVSEPVTRRLGAALEAPEPDSFQVRLAFAADVDLDLYVSDPLQETVYYANSPSRTGGSLDADARCKEATGEGVRVERVLFERARPGRYRVGVDYPESCGGDSEAAFLIQVDVGGRTRRASGVAQLLDFDSKVLEFSLDASGELVP